jgi:hypothetical protein
VPDPELKANEIKLSYLTFLELYKYEIMSHICKMDGITMTDASDLWYKAAINFNPKVYEIMKYLIKKKKIRVLVNRNPKLFGALYSNM